MNLIALSNHSNAADSQNPSVLSLSSTAAADLSRYAKLQRPFLGIPSILKLSSVHESFDRLGRSKLS